MSAIFLFDGGNYKRGEDDGRIRVPLTPQEASMVFYDPEVPADTDNSIGSELNMARYAKLFCGLEVGDEIFFGLAPDTAFYRGLWMMSFDPIPGFQVKLDLVSVPDVYAQFKATGDATGVTPFNTAAGTLEYDFSNGLGEATCDAVDLAGLYGGEWTDYRNQDAWVAKTFASNRIANLGQALYMRLTVVAIGEFGTNADGEACCNTCNNPKYPTFQAGALYDRTCTDKQRVRNFCNCPEMLCGGECPESTTTTPAPELPVVDQLADQADHPTTIVPIQLTANVPIVTWLVTGLPPSLVVDPATGIISGGLTATGGDYPVTVRGTDAFGNTSLPMNFNWNIPFS